MNSRVIIIAILIVIKVIGVASRVKADDINDFQAWKPIYESSILCDAKNIEKKMICKKVWSKKNMWGSNIKIF